MNRYIFIAAALLAATGAKAQDVWEKPQTETAQQEEATSEKKAPQKEKAEKVNKDQKYLEGAVTEKNGKVVWTMHLDCNGKDAQTLYDATMKALTGFTARENMLEGSGVMLVNKKEHSIVANGKEWLTFRSSFLSLDRAKLNYTIIARCTDGAVDIELCRMFFMYNEDGKGDKKILAEESINDKNALNKKKTKLVPGWAKFRRKAVDTKDDIMKLLKYRITKEVKNNK